MQGEADLEVDILLVDVDGVLPDLFQIVEVVYMGNSMVTIASSIEEQMEQIEPESVFLLPVLSSVNCCCSAIEWHNIGVVTLAMLDRTVRIIRHDISLSPPFPPFLFCPQISYPSSLPRLRPNPPARLPCSNIAA